MFYRYYPGPRNTVGFLLDPTQPRGGDLAHIESALHLQHTKPSAPYFSFNSWLFLIALFFPVSITTAGSSSSPFLVTSLPFFVLMVVLSSVNT